MLRCLESASAFTLFVAINSLYVAATPARKATFGGSEAPGVPFAPLLSYVDKLNDGVMRRRSVSMGFSV